MADVNWLKWAWNFIFDFLELAHAVWEFFTYDFYVLGFETNMLQVLSGTGLAVILVAVIVKALTPLF